MNVSRRAFLGGLVALPSGLLVPEPVRAYSFAGGWAVAGFITVNGRDALPFTHQEYRTGRIFVGRAQVARGDLLGMRVLPAAASTPVVLCVRESYPLP